MRKESVKLRFLTQTELGWELITNRTARLNRLEQFGDKMVATTRFSATDYLTGKVFQGVKTTGDVYRVQINDVKVRLDMMLTNELDAAWMPQPQAAMAQMKGHKLIKVPAVKDERLGVLAVRDAFLGQKGHSGYAEKLAKVYSRACDSINKNGLEAYSAEIVKYCNADTTVVRRLPRMVFTHAQTLGEEVQKHVDEYLR